MPVHVAKGARTYLPGRKSYGDVVKTTMLGTDAVIVQCDDGSMQAFCGDEILDSVVDKTTKKNGRGNNIDIPTDVKVVGPAVLEAIGLDETTRAALFQKFMVLEPEVRLEKASYWETHQADNAKMAVFLPELMTLLGEDTLYIKTQSARLLKHLDQATRDVMLTKFMTETTEDQRKAFILQFTLVRNDKFKTEEFLQGMYELLLDDVTYITMEFTKALGKRNITGAAATKLIDEFLLNTTDAIKTKIITAWRKHKMYRSSRGKSYSYNQCRKYRTR